MATGSNPPSSETPILNVVGERVALGPLREDLLPLYGRWINHPGKAMSELSYLPDGVEYGSGSHPAPSSGFWPATVWHPRGEMCQPRDRIRTGAPV